MSWSVEGKAAVASAVAAILAVGIAVVGQIDTGVHNRKSLGLAIQALTDAKTERVEQDKQSKEALALAAQSLKEEQEQRVLQEKQFTAQIKNWSEAQAAERAAREEDREERKRQELAANAPLLAITRCCNQVAIGFGDLSLEAALEMPYVSILDEFELSRLGLDPQWKEYPNSNVGVVARIQNLGPGPALETKVIWHPEIIQYVDGTSDRMPPKTPEPTNFFREYTWPSFIASTDGADIRHLPTCIHGDRTLRVALVEGQIELRCKDYSGKEHHFYQTFEMTPAYRVEPGVKLPAVVSCHFTELGDVDGPFPHTTAKPLLPNYSPNLK